MSQISELAEICGVSERAIRKFCANTFGTSGTKFRNQWNLSESQVEQVKHHYGAKPSSEPAEPSSGTAGTMPELSADREQWYRDKIDELTRMLNQEQQLHAATKAEFKALKGATNPTFAASQERQEPRRLTWRERLTGRISG